MTPPQPSAEDPIRALLRAAHHLPATGLGAVVTEQARRLGAREAVVYLADYAQHVLVPVPGEGVPGRQELTIDGSLAGRAFRRVDTVRAPAHDGPATLWVPLLDGAERMGVLELVVPGEVPLELDEDARTFAALVAEVVVTRDAYIVLFSRLRWRWTLLLAV